MALELHDYQKRAVEYLHEHDRAALFLDMGLGKTAITLSALEERHLPVLVTAPKRVAENVWPKEVELWRPDLSIAVAAGTPQQRKEVLELSGADIIVIGRDNLADAVPYAEDFNTFVWDELSSVKNKSTNRWKASQKIAVQVQHFWGLTGTPAPNGIGDLWAQVYLIDWGARLGKNLTMFRKRYMTVDRQLVNGTILYAPRPGAAAEVTRKLSTCCLSMRSEGHIKLPPVTLNKVEVKLPAKAKKAYGQLRKDLLTQLDEETVITVTSAATLTGKLSQVTAGFLYDENGEATWVHQEKMKAVEEIVEASCGSPVLVFYRFQEEKRALAEKFGDQIHTVDEPGIIEAWNRGEVPILMAHPAGAGHGLNLQHGGHTLVWTSLPWSLEEWEQANKRLARQGQQNPVVIHVIMADEPVDKGILDRLEGKASVQGAVMTALEA